MTSIAGTTTYGAISEKEENAAACDLSAEEALLAEHIENLFACYEQNGVITGNNTCTIIEVMGFQLDEAEIRAVLPDWNAVSLEVLRELVTSFQNAQNVEVKEILERLDGFVLHLTLCEYIWYKLPCTTKDPTWVNRPIKVDFHVAPRHMLFASTAVVLLLTGLSILILVAILWINQASDRQSVQMENFHLLLSSFSQSFEQHFIKAHAETMVDQVDTMAKMIEKEEDLRRETDLTDMLQDTTLLAQVLNFAMLQTSKLLSSRIEGALSALASLFYVALQNEFTALDLLAVVGRWRSDSDLQSWDTVVMQHYHNAASVVILESEQLNCPYGDCEYEAVECLNYGWTTQLSSSLDVGFFRHTHDVHRRGVFALAVFVPLLNITVCSSILESVVEETQMELMRTIVSEWNQVYEESNAFRHEIIVATLGKNASSPLMEYLTPRFRSLSACYSSGECTGMDGLGQKALRSRIGQKGYVMGYDGEIVQAAAFPLPSFQLVLLMNVPFNSILERMRVQVLDIVTYINFHTTRTTEMSIGRFDPTTRKIIPQANAVRFFDACYGPCERNTAASYCATTALNTQGQGWAITPDYRPEPVVGAFSYVGSGLELAVVIERDVAEIRSLALEALVQIFNDNNIKYTGTLETQIVGLKGMPVMKTYDRFGQCNTIKECTVRDVYGIIYRSDCVHCTRAPIPTPKKLLYFTALKEQDECDAIRNCSAEKLWNDQSVARYPLDQRNEVARTEFAKDYRDVDVLAVYSYIQNFSAGLVVKQDRSEIEGPILEMIYIAVGSALVIVFLGLTVLIVFSGKVLDKIEHEWLSYKEQMDEERVKFSKMAQNVIPAGIKAELESSHKQAVSMPALSLIFIDVCNLSEKTKNWSAPQSCRYLTYLFTVMEFAAEHYKVSKVRMFGDTYFGVGGLTAGKSKQDFSKTPLHIVSFGSSVIQLFSKKYAHYPHRIPLLQQTFEEVVEQHGLTFPDVVGNPEDVGYILMPSVRIGVHYGVATFCIIETGRTPMFDIFGPSVALAARMQATSLKDRMHLTAAAKEVLEQVDKQRLFEYDDPRKTVVKGQGTITSYFIKSSNVDVPKPVIKQLGVEHSNLRVFYDEGQKSNDEQKQQAGSDGDG